MRRARVRLHRALELARPRALAEPARTDRSRQPPRCPLRSRGHRQAAPSSALPARTPSTADPLSVTTALITLPPSGSTLLLLDTTRGGASSARLAVRITALHVRALLTDGSVALYGGDAVARSRHRGLPEADAAVVWRKPLGHEHAQARGFEERRGALQQQAILEHAAGQDDQVEPAAFGGLRTGRGGGPRRPRGTAGRRTDTSAPAEMSPAIAEIAARGSITRPPLSSPSGRSYAPLSAASEAQASSSTAA